MRFPLWTGIGVCLLALVLDGRVLGSSVQASNPDGWLDAETAAWVIEPKNEPAAKDDASLPSAFGFRLFDGHARQSVANRNRNPLNLKFGSDTRRYVEAGLATVSEIVPADGGRFLKFRSAETGFRAARDLLNTRPYGGLRVDGALRRWSNNGYGGEILAGTRIDAAAPIPSLRDRELRVLLQAMAAAEGYRSPATSDEIRRALEY